MRYLRPANFFFIDLAESEIFITGNPKIKDSMKPLKMVGVPSPMRHFAKKPLFANASLGQKAKFDKFNCLRP